MRDRWGNPIRIAFAEHEILWIEAARTLEPHARREAYRDITELTGRTYACIWQKARELEHNENVRKRMEKLTAASKAYIARYANDA